MSGIHLLVLFFSQLHQSFRKYEHFTDFLCEVCYHMHHIVSASAQESKTLLRYLVKPLRECQTRIGTWCLFTRHLIRCHTVCRCHYPYVQYDRLSIYIFTKKVICRALSDYVSSFIFDCDQWDLWLDIQMKHKVLVVKEMKKNSVTVFLPLSCMFWYFVRQFLPFWFLRYQKILFE